MERIVKAGLGTWALVWILSFWYRTEWLRGRLGIHPVVDKAGEMVDREDFGGLGEWINCPQCAALLLVGPVALLARRFPFLGDLLAALGLAQALVRWYEAARPKARWWE